MRDELVPAFTLFAANFPQLCQALNLEDGQTWGPWAAGSGTRGSDTGAGAGGGGDTGALPPRAAGKVSAFEGLLLSRTFRPDRLQSAMTGFVTAALNLRSLAPPPFSLKTLVEHESSAAQPVLFITTPGADPSQELADHAAATIGKERYHEVAMGQGQADIALTLLRECARSGDWLCLKNLHLAVSWLPVLEKELFTLQKAPQFRLFLTSEPHTKFPSTLLEGSLKITFEAPPGLKKNLLRTYEGWSNEFVAAGPPLRAQLLFVLAWFHAVVQERRSYIPQGWSKFYEFSFADLRSGADVVSLGVSRDGKVGHRDLWRVGGLPAVLPGPVHSTVVSASASRSQQHSCTARRCTAPAPVWCPSACMHQLIPVISLSLHSSLFLSLPLSLLTSFSPHWLPGYVLPQAASWRLLHGLLENAIYGGRVDNAHDGAVLRTYLHQLFSPEIVGLGGGRVVPLPGSKIVVPTTAHRADYCQLVASLPESDAPALFSLPANIDRAAQQANGERVVASLKAMALAQAASGGFNRARWQAQLGPLLRLWDSLMSQAGPLKAAAKELRAAGRVSLVGGGQSGGGAGGGPVDSFVALVGGWLLTAIVGYMRLAWKRTVLGAGAAHCTCTHLS